jgi:hypothetical protein
MRILIGIAVGALCVTLYKLFGLTITIFAIGFILGSDAGR